MELYKASIEKLIADKEAVTRINLEMQQKMRDVSLQGQRREDNQKKGGAVEQFVADELTDLVKQKHKLLEDAKVAIERANAYMGCTEKIFATGLMMNECLTKKQEELQMNAQKLESAAHQFVQKRAIRKKEVETEGIHLKRLAEETEQRLTRTADIEKLNAILLSLKQRMEHVAESVKAKEQRYDEMSTQQKQIEDETEQLQNLIKEKEELKRIILAKIESERKMATALMKKQEQLQRETNKSAQLLTERQQDLGEKKTLIEKTQAEVRELEAQLVGAKEKNTQAAAELNERKELNAKLNTELTQMRQDDVKAIRQKTAEHKEILEAAEEKLATLIKEAEKFAQECDPTKLEGYETFKDLNVETLNAMLEEALKKEEALQKEVDAKRAIQEQIIEEKKTSSGKEGCSCTGKHGRSQQA
ncbi:unnamed protein product, partial [Mesorhabditis belari]|uniref:Uncharacterized protein n=1 Tax=Mesorhabditis belari TaxID=2138241 RepID=A0AAF3J2P9_9BILA